MGLVHPGDSARRATGPEATSLALVPLGPRSLPIARRSGDSATANAFRGLRGEHLPSGAGRR